MRDETIPARPTAATKKNRLFSLIDANKKKRASLTSISGHQRFSCFRKCAHFNNLELTDRPRSLGVDPVKNFMERTVFRVDLFSRFDW